jgi:dienelactone hydrolase
LQESAAAACSHIACPCFLSLPLPSALIHRLLLCLRCQVKAYSVGEGNKAGVIVSTDIYGWQTAAARSNADIIAAAGFHVVLPDMFHGDAVAAGRMQQPGGREWLMQEWLPKHPHDQTAGVLVAVARELKSGRKLQSVEAIGFCYGAVAVLQLSKDGLISSGVVCHPSGFTEDKISMVTVPMLFNCADSDHSFGPELRQKWEARLKERMLPAKFIVYPGVEHGFVARLDGTANGLQQRQAALTNSIAFLKQGAAA